MFWVIQENVFNEDKHEEVLDVLEELKIPHAEVKVVPFLERLLPSYFDSHIYDGSIEDIAEEEINDSGPVMVLGSISLANIAKNRGWVPGSFINDNFHYSKWAENFGNQLLNSESQIGLFRNIEPKWEEFFIRPCEDNKDFNGQVMTEEEFYQWRITEINENTYCAFADSEVVISPIKEILAEYRFYIVDGEVATYSKYRENGKLNSLGVVPLDAIKFTQEMVSIWQPARAFVIDIAAIKDGFKVIEINNINSAGFYNSDVKKLIQSIERMKF